MEIEDIIRHTFGNRFTRDFSLQIHDELYKCPNITKVKELIKKNTVDRIQYVPDVFDCDDYALALKYHFIRAAYKDNVSYPYCMGMIMGNLLGNIPHAINFVITNSLKLYLIEPQLDRILKPTRKDRMIYSIYM